MAWLGHSIDERGRLDHETPASGCYFELERNALGDGIPYPHSSRSDTGARVPHHGFPPNRLKVQLNDSQKPLDPVPETPLYCGGLCVVHKLDGKSGGDTVVDPPGDGGGGGSKGKGQDPN